MLVSVLAKEVLLQSYFLSTLTTFHYFAVYEAGKAVKKGVPSHYAPTLYAPSMYAQPAYGGPLMNQPGLPLLPLPNGAGALPPPNGYSREYDGASSGEWISVLFFFSFDWRAQLLNHFCSSSHELAIGMISKSQPTSANWVSYWHKMSYLICLIM